MSVSCNCCGAPLRIPRDARFVTCNHCSAQLAVKHSESVTFTEQLGKISERTERIEEDLAELKFRQEVEDIDREWEFERQSFIVSDKHGHRSVPSTAGSVFVGVVTVGFGIFWTVMASQAGAVAVLFGFLFIGAGIVVAMRSYAKAEGYGEAERRYQQRRRDAFKRRER